MRGGVDQEEEEKKDRIIHPAAYNADTMQNQGYMYY